MDVGGLLELAGQFGPMGLFVAYMIWDKSKDRELWKEKIETDKALTTSLTLLCERIAGMKQ